MYKYRYEKGQSTDSTFILLHGTGGNEEDLLPVAAALDAKANVLSIRGNVLEDGKARYFKRLRKGQYDVSDLMTRGQELYAFIEEKAEEYQFSLEEAIYLGFSNGANIAMNMMLLEDSRIRSEERRVGKECRDRWASWRCREKERRGGRAARE